MSVLKKVKSASMGLTAGIGIGIAVSLIVTISGAALSAYLINTEIIAQGAITRCAIAILLISSALGALVTAGQVRRLRLQVCMITGAVYYLSLLAITALFFGGQYGMLGTAAVVILIGAGIAAFAGVPVKKGRKWKGLKRVYR